ncbi:MAG: RNA-binding domain-containing protein [Candidatus Woesearchaeota archaeon]
MRYIHNVKLSVFLKPEEYSGNVEIFNRIRKVFLALVPLDMEKENIHIREETVESFENRKIRIITLEISKEAHTNIFLKALKEMLGEEQCRTLLEQRWSRLDEDLYFYIRLDKEAALKDVYELTDGGECIHIKMHIAAFPKNREKALKVVEEIFS